MKFNYKNKLRLLTAAGLALLAGSCQLTELDINNDPNRPTTAAVKLLLPVAESAALGSYLNMAATGSGFAGQMSDTDNYNVDNQSYNGTWNGFYQGMQNTEEIIKATQAVNNPHYLAAAQTLKAFAMGNFVDTFGDAPYTEAWAGNADAKITQPKFDKDADIYESLIKLCDAAIANFAKASPVTLENDFMFNGSVARWTMFARSVKLRLLVNSRKGRASGNADVKAAFEAGGFINVPADNLNFRYAAVATPVDQRHPWFQSAYLADNGFSYPSHQLMSEMIFNKDPRLPFYFYRQTTKILNPNDPTDRGTIPYGGTYLVLKSSFWTRWKAVFGTQTKADSAYVAGFFGRDRGDNTGVPQDGALRTAPGCYPAGGLYSDRTTAASALTGGRGSGAGVFPIITSVNTKFWRIEAILDGTGVSGDARALFESAMREHITNVVNLGLAVDAANAKAPAAADITAYVNSQLALFDAASSNAAKLNVVAKQAWFCSWGQGTEIWNLMRRTGYPTAINNPIIKPPRQYALRLPYPSQEGNLNPNASQYVSGVIFDRDAIFWDKVKVKWEFP